MERQRVQRVMLGIALLAAAAGRGGGAAPARNAGISFTCPNAICIVKPDGSGRSVFVTTWFDSYGDPSWSRDGTALAYSVGYSDTHKIHVFEAPTRRHREFPLRGDARSFEPSWSPDGTRIAVTEITPPGVIYGSQASTIRIVTLANAERTPMGRYAPVTTPRGDRIDTEPAWSPDGRTIAFVRRMKHRRGAAPQFVDATTAPAIFLVRPDGSGVRRLTSGRSPSWSPDGTRLVFAFGDGIYEIRADGRGRTRILGGLRSPLVRWSPDGTKLAIASGRDAWVTDADGRHRVRILRERNVIWGLAWRPA